MTSGPPDPVFVISRRTVRRALAVFSAVIVVVGVGVGFYLGRHTSPRHRRSCTAVVLITLSSLFPILLAGCSSAGGSRFDLRGLISAQYSTCAHQGDSLATYLDSGRPTSDDPTYGDYRQRVLSLSGQRRSLYIRQQADALIESCDQQLAQAAQQRAAAAQAQAQAAAQAAAQAKANAELQAAQPVCRAVGGGASWSLYDSALDCSNIPYFGDDGAIYFSAVGMDPQTGQLEGPMDTGGFGATEQECISAYYPDLSTGAGYGRKGTWNGVLQACLPD